MVHRFKDPVLETPVKLLPITYPFPNRVVTLDVHNDHDKRKTTLKGAVKVVENATMRGLLKRWSGHVPVTKTYVGKELQTKSAPPPAPLKADELQVSDSCAG
jgi:hypothetical protein